MDHQPHCRAFQRWVRDLGLVKRALCRPPMTSGMWTTKGPSNLNRYVGRLPRIRRSLPFRSSGLAVMVGLSGLLATTTGCTSSKEPATTALATASTTSAPTTTRPTITRNATIVLVVPASGPLAGLGTEAREGLELAIRHATEDGRLPADMNVRIRVLDESARNFSRAVDRAVRGEDVVAITGGLLESTEDVLAPLARRRKIALFTFTWREGKEPAASVRVGPSRSSLADEAARYIVAANPNVASIALIATPGAAGSVTMRDAIAAKMAPVDAASPSGPVVTTNSPADTTLLEQVPLIVTGDGDASFERYARLRFAPSAEPPSLVVPGDALGCRAAPAGLAEGTRCVSRGSWNGPGRVAIAFREDTAAAAITPSWATVVAYDAGTLVARIAGPAALPRSGAPKDLRAALLKAKTAPMFTAFNGVSGRLNPGEGFIDNAQVLRAEGGAWVADILGANG